MIVLISPSKTFSNSNIKGNSKPYFINKTKELLIKLKALNQDKIKEVFNISDSLASKVYEYYQNYQDVAAITLYQGELYKALKQEELTFKDNKLYVLSALYGVLKPYDSISEYRLDFNIKVFGNLYKYWKEDITNYFKTNYKDEIIIDLSSNEFSKLLSMIPNVYKVDFKASDNKRLSSVLLKQLRGSFAGVIINNNIKNLEDLIKLNIEGFKYNKDKSSKEMIIFTN